MCIIDCFSRYAWAVPLKTKTISETADAFNKILSSMIIVPRIFKFVEFLVYYYSNQFSSDAGSEFSVKPGGELYNVLVEKFQEYL